MCSCVTLLLFWNTIRLTHLSFCFLRQKFRMEIEWEVESRYLVWRQRICQQIFISAVSRQLYKWDHICLFKSMIREYGDSVRNMESSDYQHCDRCLCLHPLLKATPLPTVHHKLTVWVYGSGSGVPRGVVWGVQTPPKFRRYRWSPRSHKQEEPASRFPFLVHCVLIRL